MSTFRQDSWGDPMDGWGSSGGGGSGGGGGGAATGTTESTALDGSGGITSQDPKAPEVREDDDASERACARAIVGPKLDLLLWLVSFARMS